MVIVLDTNIWIKGIQQAHSPSYTLLNHLTRFNLVFPEQVRSELVRNFTPSDMRLVYRLVHFAGGIEDFRPPPRELCERYYKKGLRKGDMIIAAFCEWQHVDVIVSTNRDYLRGISGETPFQVLDPGRFCLDTGLL